MKELSKIFLENVNDYKQKIFLVENGKEYTYSKFYSAVERKAQILKRDGIPLNSAVLVSLSNSVTNIECVYALIISGITFVPVPPISKLGKERLVELAKVTGAYGLICDVDLSAADANFNPASFFNATYTIDSNGELNSSNMAQENEEYSLYTDIIYIIFTSGTTGNPKGACITHKGFLNYLVTTIEQFKYDSDTAGYLSAPLYFDGSFGIHCVMAVGGKIILNNDEFLDPQSLVDSIIENNVTHFSCTPFTLTLLLVGIENRHFKVPLKTIGLGGEDFSKELVHETIDKLPNARLFNRYGPTETTVVCSSFEITKSYLETHENIPIGKPFPNMEFHIIKDRTKILDSGVTGELYISGIQVMDKYIGVSQQSQDEILVKNVVDGKTLYKTGDLVKRDEQGNYIYLGRCDDQIKRLGNRFHLSEMDLRIQSLEEIGAVKTVYVNKLLISYVVLMNGCSDHNLRNLFSMVLESYMFPDRIIEMESLPVGTTGKVDIAKLKQVSANN